jgi:hypothetical protein
MLACSGGAYGQANLHGQWQTVPTTMPINPVHVSLMRNGKILVVSGSRNLPSNTSFAAAVWDPASNTVTTQPIGWDVFCKGMVALPDGRILVAGGNLQYDPFYGWQRTAIYDPVTGKFVDMQDMAHGRWYPTTTELGDGRILVFSGLSETGSTNTQLEIYKVGQGWGSPTTATWTPPLYPRLHLLPNGNVFYAGWTTPVADLQHFERYLVGHDRDDQIRQQPNLRFLGPLSLDPREWLNPKSHHLWRRQPFDRHNRNHRPVSLFARLELWPVDGQSAYRDERYPPAQWQDPDAWWFAER